MRLSLKDAGRSDRLDGSDEGMSPPVSLETVDCLLCGGRSFGVVVHADDNQTEFRDEFCVVRCMNCGLAFTNPRPTESSIGRFYPATYPPHALDNFKQIWRGPVQQRLERAVLRSFFKYPPQPTDFGTTMLGWLGRARIRRRERRCGWVPYRGEGRLLDFGCGKGSFLVKMRSCGWSVEGVEQLPAIAERVQSETGIKVHVGSLPHVDIRPGTFDIVTMWDALEHVHEPRTVIRAAREALTREGLLVVGVPNFESRFFGVFRQYWFPLELPRHLVHFTPKTLSEMLRAEGFAIREVQHVGHDGWLRHSIRLSPRRELRYCLLRPLRWKPLALAAARWTEWTRQADYIRIVAQREYT